MSRDSKLSIAMFPSDKFGCGFYRLIQPGKKLAKMGHSVQLYFDFQSAFKPTTNPITGKPMPNIHDIYHFQRITTTEGLRAVREAKKRGVVIIDLDDDLLELYPGHPSAWYFGKGQECLTCGNPALRRESTKCSNCAGTNLLAVDRTQLAVEAIKEADYVTVSTKTLLDKYVKFNSSIAILPNSINFEEYDDVPSKNQTYLTVGWAGSGTHRQDLSAVINALEVIKEYPNVYFTAAGDDSMVELFEKTFGDRFIDLAPVPVTRYPELIHNFDIGIAPVVDNTFNRSKSNLKVLEYGAAKIPFVASDVVPYKEFVTPGVNGFLAAKPKHWRNHLRKLIENPELRQAMGEAAYVNSKRFDLETTVLDRLDLYYQVLESRE